MNKLAVLTCILVIASLTLSCERTKDKNYTAASATTSWPSTEPVITAMPTKDGDAVNAAIVEVGIHPQLPGYVGSFVPISKRITLPQNVGDDYLSLERSINGRPYNGMIVTQHILHGPTISTTEVLGYHSEDGTNDIYITSTVNVYLTAPGFTHVQDVDSGEELTLPMTLHMKQHAGKYHISVK